MGRRTVLAGILACVLGTLVVVTAGRLPGAPEPALLSVAADRWARLGALGVAAGGFAFALRAPAVGGAIAVAAACCVGALTAFAAPPIVAIMSGLALLLPALVLIVRGRSRASVVAGAWTSVCVVVASVVASWGYGFMYGATHPSSTAAGPPHGATLWVWSGGVTSTSAVVTATLERPDGQATLRVSPPAEVATERDGEVVRFRLSRLRPGGRVEYAVLVNGHDDGSGHGAFRTVPSGASSFTIAFSSCARTGSNGAVFDAIRAEDPLMYFNLGDLYYADITGPDTRRFSRAFDRVLTRPAQANLYRSTSTTYVWDDHDFGGNDADGTSRSAPAAHAVYRRLVPHHAFAIAGPRAPLARAFSAGRVRFIVTDTRSARSPGGQPDGPGKSMLGPAQRAWLEAELLAARDRFPVIVWVNPDPWIGAPRDGADGWAGYATERAELARFIADNAITGLVMLSGDTHAVALDDGTNTGYAGDGRRGFPLLHAGALDRAPQHNGGPYSHGEFLGGGQYGTLEIEDDGGPMVSVTLRGHDWQGNELTSLRLQFAVPRGGGSRSGAPNQ